MGTSKYSLFDQSVSEAYTQFLDLFENDAKLDQYLANVKWVEGDPNRDGKLEFAGVKIMEAIVAEKIPPGEDSLPIQKLEEAQKSYRALLEHNGVGAQTSKLIVKRETELAREAFKEIAPEIHEDSPQVS